MTDSQIEQAEREIEISIEAAREIVEKKDKLEKLLGDETFKEIFEEGYFKEEAARLTGLLTDPEFNNEEGRRTIVEDLVGISAARKYILNILRFGHQMERRIAASEKELEALRTEGE
jgi:hypothetical protein